MSQSNKNNRTPIELLCMQNSFEKVMTAFDLDFDYYTEFT